MALSREERELFLAEPRIAALAVNAGPGRGPVMLPIWYQYQPGGDPWIVTEADSRKAKLIAKAGHFSLLVERHRPTIRYVSVEGPVRKTIEATHDRHVELASRYLPADAVDGYVAMADAEFGPLVTIHMDPQHWLSADLGPG